MNNEIQPKYSQIKVICSCGVEATVGSTLNKELQIEVCSACHPFYTGKQKANTAGGRIDRFNRRFKKSTKAESEKSAN
ncbi:MAG: 50S ribosomal protein L31 [Legionellales bacterium]|mgnify:CR=1 FL=1|nr:50S ribosomal protein L31 [Legionellales bacterium]|tara:strand:- start:752 stop:985 length:234 start_codon:yes stop_codon:yes gene_type:complete